MSKTLKALVIDDDDLARRCLSSIFRAEGWKVHESQLLADPYELVSLADWNVVICALTPERGYGFELFQTLAKDLPNRKLVLTTSQPSAKGALAATTFGIYEYLPKPLDEEAVHGLSDRLRQRFNTSSGFVVTNQSKKNRDLDPTLIGKSHSFIDVMKQVGRVAATSLPVLLTGESGTGKEVVAAALHDCSTRRDGPFVALNCGAMPAELIESELFGHEKGSFTGADRERRGLWEEAEGGTIFLDEITETSLSFQVKLLRTFQRGEVRRVGSNQMRRMDVRVIAASNRDVEQEVEAGRFRHDLFYRLNAVYIRLPSLRERKEDIPLLIEAFVRRVADCTSLKFSSEVIEILHQYPWPGNVRELENAVVRSVAMCDGIVLVQDLPERIRNHSQSIVEARTQEIFGAPLADWPSLGAVEGEYVTRALGHTNWNKQATARMLNVDRKTVDRMIKRYNINRGSETSELDRDRWAA
jgi:DNA-binding NtrC family response regulator